MEITKKEVGVILLMIWKNPEAYSAVIRQEAGGIEVKVGDLADQLNEHYSRHSPITSRQVGVIVRNEMDLPMLPRRADGFWLFLDLEAVKRIRLGMAMRPTAMRKARRIYR